MGTTLFRDAGSAERELERLRITLPPKLGALLPTLLADSPDPNASLNLLERLCRQASPALLGRLERDTYLAHYALIVFGYSRYLGDALLQNLDLFARFADSKDLERSFGIQDYEAGLKNVLAEAAPGDFSAALARFKKREYLRIMLRDVLGIAALGEITAEISALAETLVAEALRRGQELLRQRYASDVAADEQFAIVALGKLGGYELNYNSDADLLYLFSDEAQPLALPISNKEYFVKLAQTVTEILSRNTAEGPVLRIDLRLRPQGNEGEPAIPVSQALRYYAEGAHDWELQALIKARHIAGAHALTRDFLRGVQSRVYRKGLNFAAIETALISAQKIRDGRGQRAARRLGAALDVKLDRGGIRDIEFLAQCLQRVYGGEETWLHAGGTLFALQKLHDKRHISGGDFQQLSQAYEFLRKLEHRLQLRDGRQTHSLPREREELEFIARAMAPALDSGGAATPEALMATVEMHMRQVMEVHARLLHTQQAIHERALSEEQFRLAPAITAEEARDGSYQQLLSRLAIDSPVLYAIAARRDMSARTRRLLHRFLSSALTSSERYGAVLRAAPAVEQALNIFEASDFVSEILIGHPDEILTIEKIAASAGGNAVGQALTLDSEAGGADAGRPMLPQEVTVGRSYAEKLALLRRNYRHQVFALAANDILAAHPVFDSLELATVAADSAIAAALEIAHQENGARGGDADDFAILGLGRLGTREFDLGSDADLLFVRSEEADAAGGARLARQIVEILAAYTQEGTVFPVDTRLRPLGAEGELVTTPAALRSYFSGGGEAQAWEALSFTKLRWICGSIPLTRRAIVAARTPAERFSTQADFLPRLLAMRRRLAQAQRPGENFKTAAGGYYDIDFITGYLLVKQRPLFSGHNTRQRLHALAAVNLISDGDCATLDYAAELMRATDHAIRLVSGRAPAVLPAAEHARASVEQIAARLLQASFANGLSDELRQATTQVREVFARILA